MALRGGSGSRALAPSGPVTSAGLSVENVTSSSGLRASARVQDAIARLNGSLGRIGLAACFTVVGRLDVDGGHGTLALCGGAGSDALESPCIGPAPAAPQEFEGRPERQALLTEPAPVLDSDCGLPSPGLGVGSPNEKANSMNAPAFPAAGVVIPAEFQTFFDAQRAAYLKAPEPAHAERVADLKALARLVRENQAAIVGRDQRRLRQSQRLRDQVRRRSSL